MGIWPVKTSPSKHIGIAVNISGFVCVCGLPTCLIQKQGYEEFSACPAKMLWIRKIGD